MKNMNVGPLVSVIVPVYKKEDTLDRCINSILSQTYKNFELILIEDGSPDRCAEICDEYQNKDDRITVLHQKNSGVSVARNRGIALSKGEFITFVDADDRLNTTFIEYGLDLYEESVDIVVMSNSPNVFSFRKKVNNMQAMELMFLDDGFGVNVWGKIYRKQSIPPDVFLKGVKMGEDMAALFQIIKNARYVIYDSKSYYEQIGASFNSYQNADISDFHVPILLLKEIKQQAESFCLKRKYCFDVALVMRCVWLINIMELKSNFQVSYYESCRDEICDFLKRYPLGGKLIVKYRIAVFAICFCPSLYRKMIRKAGRKFIND